MVKEKPQKKESKGESTDYMNALVFFLDRSLDFANGVRIWK